MEQIGCTLDASFHRARFCRARPSEALSNSDSSGSVGGERLGRARVNSVPWREFSERSFSLGDLQKWQMIETLEEPDDLFLVSELPFSRPFRICKNGKESATSGEIQPRQSR